MRPPGTARRRRTAGAFLLPRLEQALALALSPEANQGPAFSEGNGDDEALSCRGEGDNGPRKGSLCAGGEHELVAEAFRPREWQPADYGGLGKIGAEG